MITIRYDGRFGNNLFQYTLARLLAEKYDLQLMDNLIQNPILTNTPNPTGRVFTEPKCLINDSIHNIPENLQNGNYLLWGWFQRIQFYKYYREKIKTFFNYDISNIATNKNDIVMHVRLTDYVDINWAIHQDYYLNIFKNETYNNIYLITDEPNSNYFDAFKDYKIINISASAKDDFFNLMSFDKVIMSNSTFAWWSMFLGNSSKIYTFKNWVTNPDNKQPVCSTDHINNLYDLPNAIPVIDKFYSKDNV